jgi:hypothetical protein
MLGRTITKALSIEARQHELFGVDLGDGFKRKDVGLGVLVFAATLLVTFPIVKLTGFLDAHPETAIPAMLFPGLLVVILGFRPSEQQPRRMALTVFALKLRYLFVGHQPVIALGARPATRHERIGLWSRFRPGIAAYLNERSAGRRSYNTATREVDLHEAVQPVIPENTHATRLIGNDALHELITKKGKRHGTGH